MRVSSVLATVVALLGHGPSGSRLKTYPLHRPRQLPGHRPRPGRLTSPILNRAPAAPSAPSAPSAPGVPAAPSAPAAPAAPSAPAVPAAARSRPLPQPRQRLIRPLLQRPSAREPYNSSRPRHPKSRSRKRRSPLAAIERAAAKPRREAVPAEPQAARMTPSQPRAAEPEKARGSSAASGRADARHRHRPLDNRSCM